MKPATQPVTHTPGHWELDSAKDGDSRYFVIHGQIPAGINADFGYPVADTMNRHHCVAPDEDEANARLIAAAPELLEALKDVTERLALSLQVFGNSPEVVNANVANARAAIRKATGAEGTRP